MFVYCIPCYFIALTGVVNCRFVQLLNINISCFVMRASADEVEVGAL